MDVFHVLSRIPVEERLALSSVRVTLVFAGYSFIDTSAGIAVY